MKNKTKRKKVIKEGSIHQTVRTLQSYNWLSLVLKTKVYETRQNIFAQFQR